MGDISETITQVADVAKETLSGSTDTQQASEELAKMAGHLQHLVSQFRF